MKKNLLAAVGLTTVTGVPAVPGAAQADDFRKTTSPRRVTRRFFGGIAAGFLIVAASVPMLAAPALASPQNCQFSPVTLNDVPIASFGQCSSGTGKYRALVWCNGWKYSVYGPWKNAGSGSNSYAWCNDNFWGTPDEADFVGYSYSG